MKKKKEKKVLLIVDPLNDFVHPDGALYVLGGEKVILAIESLLKEKRRDYDLVIVTHEGHPRNHYSFKANGGPWPEHGVEGTWGAGILLSSWSLKQVNYFVVKGYHPTKKNDYSAFSGYATNAPCNLSIREIFTAYGWKKGEIVIDVIGIALDYCVKVTAINAARKLGYKTRVLLRYTKAVNLNPGDDKKAIEEMKKEGVKIVK